MVWVINEPKPLSDAQPKPRAWVAEEDSAASREKAANNEITILINKIITLSNTLATSELALSTVDLKQEEKIKHSLLHYFVQLEWRECLLNKLY